MEGTLWNASMSGAIFMKLGLAPATLSIFIFLGPPWGIGLKPLLARTHEAGRGDGRGDVNASHGLVACVRSSKHLFHPTVDAQQEENVSLPVGSGLVVRQHALYLVEIKVIREPTRPVQQDLPQQDSILKPVSCR